MDTGDILEFRTTYSRYVCEIAAVQYPDTAFAFRIRAGTTSPHLQVGDLVNAIVHYGKDGSLVGGAVQFPNHNIVTGKIVEMSIRFPEGPRPVDVREPDVQPARPPRRLPKYVPYGALAPLLLIAWLGATHYLTLGRP